MYDYKNSTFNYLFYQKVESRHLKDKKTTDRLSYETTQPWRNSTQQPNDAEVSQPRHEPFALTFDSKDRSLTNNQVE